MSSAIRVSAMGKALIVRIPNELAGALKVKRGAPVVFTVEAGELVARVRLAGG